MRRLIAVSVVLAMTWATAIWAGDAAAPDAGKQGRQGGRQGRQGGGPGGGFRGGNGGPGGGAFGRLNREADLFDVARHTATLADDKAAALENLAIEFAVAENDATAEIHKKLNKEYLAKVVALLPDDQKPKYEKAIAAMTERDDANAAAEKELRDVLGKIRVSQGADKVKPAADAGPGGPGGPGQRFFQQARRGEVPTRKMDALRTSFVLTADQQQQIQTISDANRTAVREKMRAQFANLQPAGGGRPDPAQMRRMAPLFRQARTQADEEDVKAVANLLTDGQKKDFATMTAAMDAYNKKVADADAACRAKVVEALGAEKADAILGLTAEAAAAGNAGTPPAKGTAF